MDVLIQFFTTFDKSIYCQSCSIDLRLSAFEVDLHNYE